METLMSTVTQYAYSQVYNNGVMVVESCEGHHRSCVKTACIDENGDGEGDLYRRSSGKERSDLLEGDHAKRFSGEFRLLRSAAIVIQLRRAAKAARWAKRSDRIKRHNSFPCKAVSFRGPDGTSYRIRGHFVNGSLRLSSLDVINPNGSMSLQFEAGQGSLDLPEIQGFLKILCDLCR